MRKQWKNWLNAFLVLTLVIGLLPVLPKQTAAATPGFFYPDNTALSQLANPDSGLSSTAITAAFLKQNSYAAPSATMNLTGTFTSVNSDSIKIKVEQMVNGGGTDVWAPDTTRVATKSVTATGNRFEVSNVQLFNGYNKLTLSGTQNGSERKDVFYVLFENAPYLSSLKVRTDSGADAFALNEGAPIVVEKPSSASSNPDYKMYVSLEGVSVNATNVTVGTTSTTPSDPDGLFYPPPIQLQPGRNDITITLSNSSNSVQVVRTLYYFDSNNPVLDVTMDHGTETGLSVKTATPTLTDTATTADLNVTMLVPYSAMPVNTDPVVKANPNTTAEAALPVNGLTSTTINDFAGNPKYKYVSFTAQNYTLTVSSATYSTQTFTLQADFGGGAFVGGVKNLSYKYFPGSVKINDIKLINDYGKTTANESSLDGAVLNGSDFYVKIITDKALGAAPLNVPNVRLLPYNTTSVTASLITSVDATHNIYLIKGLPNGQQQLEFVYPSSSSTYVANVNFVSKNYISVDSLYDGQVITIDSSKGTGTIPPMTITGSFVNFNSLANLGAVFSLNGLSLPAVATSSIVSSFNVNSTAGTFKAVIPFEGTGAFNYGENNISISAYDRIGDTYQLIKKDLRIYVIDKNIPNIEKAQPLELPTSGDRPVLDATLFNTAYKQIRFSNDKYITKLKKVDIGIKGSGADVVTVFKDGNAIMQVNTTGTASTYKATDGSYEYTGSRDNFMIRYMNVDVPDSGSYVYNIEFRTSTGVRVTQRLEIMHEAADIVIWAPVATVSDRIVVNKNFVLFDVEAEAADKVTIDGNTATARTDIPNRFVYNYIGLKKDKEQAIKVVVTRSGKATTQTVTVLYTGAPSEEGAQYMEKMSTKHTAFGGALQLTFPKGTVLKTANLLTPTDVVKYYDRQNLFFGVASATDGVVERINDYGELKSIKNDSRFQDGTHRPITIDTKLSRWFSSTSGRNKFTTISPIFWVSGGLGESSMLKKSAVDGIPPYSIEGTYTSYPQDRKLVPTARGQITLQFNGSIVEAAGTVVTVLYLNDQGEWKNLGGVVDSKKGTITVPFDSFGYYMVAKLKDGFSDVTNHPWARNMLEALYAKGIMENARTDEFGTDDFISRGEFTTLLVRALQLPLNYDSNNTFFDVYDGSRLLWRYPEIETAARAGIVTGLENRFFGVNQRITRGQAATMIARALNLKVALNDTKLQTSLGKTFTDAASMVGPYYYALPSIDAVNKAGIMVGIANDDPTAKKPTYRFDATSNMTRAQAGAIMVRLLKKSSNIFPKNFDEKGD